jgi:hypothetical protein
MTGVSKVTPSFLFTVSMSLVSRILVRKPACCRCCTTRTAAAIRVPVHGYDLFFGGKDCSGRQQRNGCPNKHGSARQPRIKIGHDGPPQWGTISRLNG